MTTAELEALPVTIGLVTAAQAIGLGRSQAYELQRRDEFPVRVRTLCGHYKVSKFDLLAYLGAPGYPADAAGAEPEWDRPLQVTRELAEGIARMISKQSEHAGTTAEQVSDELARPGDDRSIVVRLASRGLGNLWAEGALTADETGRVGLKDDPRIAEVAELAIAVHELEEQARYWRGRRRELAASPPAEDAEEAEVEAWSAARLEAMEAMDTITDKLIELMRRTGGQS
ncbi:MAG: hypothetical protein M3Y33_07295 [Actinomycetota bacterium]|nr:hypothetical protein [Actinomycetota bacterium]